MNDVATTFALGSGLLAWRRAIGSSIWEYLWLRAHVSTWEPDGNGELIGVVEHGKAIPTNRIAADLQRSREATLANLEKLESGGYIARAAAVGHAYNYRVCIFLEGIPHVR